MCPCWTFILSVLASVAAHYICKLLDKALQGRDK